MIVGSSRLTGLGLAKFITPVVGKVARYCLNPTVVADLILIHSTQCPTLFYICTDQSESMTNPIPYHSLSV